MPLRLPASRKPISTHQAIAHTLRQAIIDGRLLAGESLRQEELARQFKVSRIPVREALRQLESENWIVFLPNKGASVAPLSIEEASETYEILTALECVALRLAVPRHTAATLHKAEQMLRTVCVGREEGVKRNRAFHMALYAPAGRPRLLGLIEAHRQRSQRYLRLYFESPKYREQTDREHAAILQACKDRDTARAVSLLEKHLQQTGAMLVKYFEDHVRRGRASDADDTLTALQQAVTFIPAQ
ncbi:MAG TPA: GntR family transcriptional regulator [Terriglobales bacterium]|nr:GntR family transcriptional regulator [Terriglobales bacterium]